MTTPVRWGGELLVNTTVAGNQERPTITALADGRFAVAWRDASLAGGDGSSLAIRAQVFGADGAKAGAELLVNTTTAGTQEDPTITALADGRFVVAWRDLSETGGDTSGSAIRAQIFAGDGGKVGAELLVNTTITNAQAEPTLTALSDGRFVVAWSDQSQSGGDRTSWAIRAQIFDAQGAKAGAELLVNTTTQSLQIEPTITALAGGRFVVAWRDDSETGGDVSGSAIRAQVFEANGGKAGAEFVVNTTTESFQLGPTVATLADGRFVVAWEDTSETGGDGSSSAVRAQVFDADGGKAGAELLVNTATQNDQLDPTVTALADGRFVVAWRDESRTAGDTSGSAIRAQVFEADGSKAGAEFLANTTTATFQWAPTIAALADGRFIVAWEDFSRSGGDTAGWAVRAQIFDPRTMAASLEGTALADQLHGTMFGDAMSGAGGSDQLYGYAGNDVLVGGAGDDILEGGAGDDLLDGGSGSDAAVFAGARAGFALRAFASGDGRIFTQMRDLAGSEGTDTLVAVETLGFAGRAYGIAGIQQNATANLDGGAFNDILFQNLSGGAVHYVDGGPGGGAFAMLIGSLPPGWRVQASGDFSGDGMAEIVIKDVQGLIYTFQADGATAQLARLTPDWNVIGVGDFTGDGALDLVVREDGAGTTYVRELDQGGDASPYLVLPNVGSAWRIVGFGDLDRDGVSDMVVQEIATGLTYYANMDAGGVQSGWGFVAGGLGGTGWRAAGVGDLNGDGFDDVVFRNATDGRIWAVDMLGGTNAGWTVVTDGIGPNWDVFDVIDHDNDGFDDVIIREATTGQTAAVDVDSGAFAGLDMLTGVMGSDWVLV